MTCPSAADTALELDFRPLTIPLQEGQSIFENVLQLRYYRVLSKALLGFSVPDKQPSMTAHYKLRRDREYLLTVLTDMLNMC